MAACRVGAPDPVAPGGVAELHRAAGASHRPHLAPVVARQRVDRVLLAVPARDQCRGRGKSIFREPGKAGARFIAVLERLDRMEFVQHDRAAGFDLPNGIPVRFKL